MSEDTFLVIILNIIISLIVGGIAGFLFSYLKEKGKNVATRQDIELITKKIENVKLENSVLLRRRSKIYDRQLETLSKLYRCLNDVQTYSQLMTRALTLEGEKTDEYPKHLDAAIKEADDEFVKGILFLPLDVEEKLNAFFKKIFEMQVQWHMVKFEVLDGEDRAKYWKGAADIAHKEIPALLETIKARAREIVEGEKQYLMTLST